MALFEKTATSGINSKMFAFSHFKNSHHANTFSMEGRCQRKPISTQSFDTGWNNFLGKKVLDWISNPMKYKSSSQLQIQLGNSRRKYLEETTKLQLVESTRSDMIAAQNVYFRNK